MRTAEDSQTELSWKPSEIKLFKNRSGFEEWRLWRLLGWPFHTRISRTFGSRAAPGMRHSECRGVGKAPFAKAENSARRATEY